MDEKVRRPNTVKGENDTVPTDCSEKKFLHLFFNPRDIHYINLLNTVR